MRIFSEKLVRRIKTHAVCSKIFFRNRTVYVTMWQNMVQPDKSQMTIYMAYTLYMLNT